VGVGVVSPVAHVIAANATDGSMTTKKVYFRLHVQGKLSFGAVCVCVWWVLGVDVRVRVGVGVSVSVCVCGGGCRDGWPPIGSRHGKSLVISMVPYLRV
jgi:hypothetical protein